MASLAEQLSRNKTRLTEIKHQVNRCKARNESHEKIDKLREELEKLREEQETLNEKERAKEQKKLKKAEEKLRQKDKLREEQETLNEKERAKEQKKLKKAEEKLRQKDKPREELEKLREEQETLNEKERAKEQKKLKKAEEKLKKAEETIRQKDEQLKQELGLTRKEWLKQDLPEFQGTFGQKPGRRDDNWTYKPQAVKKWNGFEKEVRKAYASVDDSGSYGRIRFDLKQLEGDNELIPSIFYSLVLNGIIELYPAEGCKLGPTPTLSHRKEPPNLSPKSRKAWELANPSKRIIPDYVIKKGSDIFFVAEMKRTTTFRENSTEEIVNLGRTYHTNNIHADCIRQLMKYLVRLKLGYGVLSTADISYFVKRTDSEEETNFNCLEISNGVAWDSREPTLLQALYYMYHRAIFDMETCKAYKFTSRIVSPSREETGDSSVGTSSGDEYKSGKKGGASSGETSGESETDENPPSKRHCTMVLRSRSLGDTPAHNLNLAEAPFASGGSSGNVTLGYVEGQRVAVKLAPVDTSIGKALLNEVEVYIKLRKFWGQWMPRLVHYGTTVQGQVIYIATEFIIGSSIGLKPVTPEVAMAARQGLHAIHMSHILHGDIHEDNILVVGSGVRFIDFGFARSSTSSTECKRELEQLEAIIGKNTEMTT